LGKAAHMNPREVFDALSKALVTIAVMLSVLIAAAGPAEESPARPITALLLAVGTLGLVALNLGGKAPERSPKRR
jgi:hypothetical protein